MYRRSLSAKRSSASAAARIRLRLTAVPFVLALALLVQGAMPAAAAAESPFRIHVVEAGESLSEIAAVAEISVPALIELNQIGEPDRIPAGSAIVIPASGTVEAPAEERDAGVKQTYRVQPGDTLSAIVGRFETDIRTITELNSLPDEDAIRVGMLLTVPITAQAHGSMPDARHTVRNGETVSDIATRYGVEESTLIRTNRLEDPDRIRAGMLLVVPARSVASPPLNVVRAIADAAAAHDLDPYLLLGLSYVESGWQMDVVSPAGAVGLMQLMPETAVWITKKRLLGTTNWQTSLIDNARVGSAYLDDLLTVADGDLHLALAAYYQGWSSVQREGLFPDTRQYVDDVLALAERFRAGARVF